MIEFPPRPTYAIVDLNAIQNNIHMMRKISGTPVMAVVKANAYGHGAEQVARAARDVGVDWFGVAFSGEGIHLRKENLEGNILVLGYTPAHLAGEAIQNNLSLTVYNAGLAKQYAETARALGKKARLHVKVDSGMGRLGLSPQEAPEFIRMLHGLPGVIVEGVFTHFATADDEDPTFSERQITAFRDLVAQLDSQHIRPQVVHASNSAAGLRFAQAHFDLVRLGISLYGLHPSGAIKNPPTFQPALEWKTTVAQVKSMPPGTSISYGRIYTTQGQEEIAALPVGYADGYRRNPIYAPWVILHGKRIPVVGRICMDQMMVNVTGIENIHEGDEVVLIGRQGDEFISAEEVGSWWGTINYEVTSCIMARVPRIYK